jgi:hypothetical protein
VGHKERKVTKVPKGYKALLETVVHKEPKALLVK